MNVAKRLKAAIREKTRLTASAGVAPNKFLAKIASAWRKPDGLTVIAPERVESFLQQLPVDALWGVGPVTAERLRERGIERLVDVRTADPAVLRSAVGSMTDWLLKLAAGEDDRPVEPNRPSKSSSSECTYAQDLTDLDRIREEIADMARDNAEWLQKDRPRRPHRDDQGSLRRLHDDHAERHAPRHERRRRHRAPRRRAARQDRRGPPAGTAAGRRRSQLRGKG